MASLGQVWSPAMSRRRNSDSHLKKFTPSPFENDFLLADTSHASQRLHDFVMEAVHAGRRDDDYIANGKEILCRVFPHLSDVIDSFYRGVYGFLRQIHARGTDLQSIEGVTESDERPRKTAIDNTLARSKAFHSKFADTLETVHEHGLADGETFEPQFVHRPCTWLEVEDSDIARDETSPIDSVEEDPVGDNDGREAVSPALDGEWDCELSGSARSEPLYEPSGTPATEALDSDVTGADERMDTDDALNLDDQLGTVSVETSFQSEQDVRNEEAFDDGDGGDDGDDEERRSATGEEPVSDTNDNLGDQRHPKPTDQAAQKKRPAMDEERQRKKPKTSRTEGSTGRLTREQQTPDSTGVPGVAGLSPADLPTLPPGTIAPRAVYTRLRDRCGSQPHQDLLFLVRLFFSLGSPATIVQLRDSVLMMRRLGSVTTRALPEMAHINQFLDQLELGAPLRRRYGLVRLHQRRRELETYHRDQNGVRRSPRERAARRRSQHASSRTGRCDRPRDKTDAAALDDLTEECYPCMHRPREGAPDPQDEEFMLKRGGLQYRLSMARHYALLQEIISVGSVALIPVEGFSASRLERLPDHVFAAFLDILEKERGAFLRTLTATVSDHLSDLLWQSCDGDRRYAFEGLERQSLAQMAFDGDDLIKACEFEEGEEEEEEEE